MLSGCQKIFSVQAGDTQEVKVASQQPQKALWVLGVWDGMAERAARGGNATSLFLSLGTEQVWLLQSSSLASKLVTHFARKVAQVLWCSVDKHVPHDGNGVILLRWGAYLEAAE